MLYFCEIKKNTIITHDGFFQLGFFRMCKEDFLEKVKVKYIEVYWIPNVVIDRYKTVSYQNHLRAVNGLSTII